MNAYIKFCEILSICSQDIERKLNFGVNQRPYLWYKCAKNDLQQCKLDLVNMNAYIKFAEIMSICSQDIEWKRNFGVKHEST